MAMNVGSRSIGEPEMIVDINTTPLIDVMLVLLIMLIITIPIQLHSVNLNMPVDNHTPPPPVTPEIVQIEIENTGAVRWNGELVANAQTLNERFAVAAAQSVQPELHVRPNRLAPYKSVAAVMASAQRNHATKIGIVGNEQYI